MKRAYLDSSIWIARTEGLPVYREFVRKELMSLTENDWQFCFSDVVILEVLIKPQRQNQEDLLDIYKEAFMEATRLCTFDSVFQNALVYAQRDGLKALDAIHVAFAVNYECGLFVTTDPDFRSLKSLPLHWIDLRVLS